MKAFRKGDRVVFTGAGAARGLGSWLGAPFVGTVGIVEHATVGEARAELMVRWEGQLVSVPVMGADVAPYAGDG